MKKVWSCMAIAIFMSLFVSSLYPQDVTPHGSFTYRYPIKLPPGTNGMAPELALVYDSFSENGILGMGWSIEGLSLITRDSSCGIKFDSTDHFIYNGQKLIYSGASGTETYYQTEKESYLRIKAVWVADDVDYWEVTDKNGKISYFGGAPNCNDATDGRIEAVGISGNKARVWAVHKVIDTLQNHYTIEYQKDDSNGDYYPDRIIYTLNTDHPLLSYNTVEFSYETRGDHGIKYLPTRVDVKNRLNWITIKVGGNLLRKYRIDYSNECSTGRSRIVAIQEYGNDGVSTLPAVTFEWSDVSNELVANSQIAYEEAEYERDRAQYYTGDFNGDGKTDLLGWYKLSNGDSRIFEWDGTEGGLGAARLVLSYTATEYERDKAWYYTGDFNGDGKTDLLGWYRYDDGSNRIFEWDGTEGGLGAVHSTLSYTAAQWTRHLAKYYIGDFNGDGKTDLLGWCRYDDSSSKIFEWDGTEEGLGAYHIAVSYTVAEYVRDRANYYVGDFNGDGKTDLLGFYKNIDGSSKIYEWDGTQGGLGAYRIVLSYTAEYDRDHAKYYTGDFNGDGKTDLLGWYQYDDDSNKIYEWDGTQGGLGANRIVLSYTAAEWLRYLAKYYTGDFNGDGKIDLLAWYENSDGSSKIYEWYGTEGGVGAYHIAQSYTAAEWTRDNAWYCTEDFNGDGKTDLFGWYKYQNGNSRIYEWKHSQITTPDLLTVTHGSSGGTVKAEYTPKSYIPGAIVPSVPIGSIITDSKPYCLVTQLICNGGIFKKAAYIYNYYNGKRLNGYPWQRYALGFEWTTVTDSSETTTKTHFLQTDRYHAGLPLKMEVCDSESHLFKTIAYDYDDSKISVPENSSTQSHASKFIYKSSEVTKEYDGDSTEESAQHVEYKIIYREPDDYGNIRIIENLGDTSVENDNVTMTSEYAINPINWVMKPKHVKKESFSLDGTSIGLASEVFLFYDNKEYGQIGEGLLTKKVTENGTTDPAETYKYNVHGNLEWMKDARVNSGEYGGYTLQIQYNSSAYPTDRINALDQATHIGYDELMRPTSTTDANGVQWKTTYDVFGRVTSEIDPGDTAGKPTKRYTYSDVAVLPDSPCFVMTELKESEDKYLASYSYFEGLGRVIQKKSPADEENQWITVDLFYDTTGRNYRTSVPYLTNDFRYSTADENQKYTKNEYDAIGRVVKTINTDGTASYTAYRHRERLFLDENSHLKAQRIWGAEVFDYDYEDDYTPEQLTGSINLEIDYYKKTATKKGYDGIRISEIVAGVVRSTIETTLDRMGRKTDYMDPDMGHWTYSYDVNGNLLTQKDAKNQIISFQYDKLNRPVKKIYPSPSTEEIRYHYDEPGQNYPKGRLTRVSRFDGSIESNERYLVYDERGRVASEQKTIFGENRVLNREYDPMDRVISEIYPDGEVVNYSFGRMGNLKDVTGDEQYVTHVGYTPLGKVSEIGYGNGIETSYDYYDLYWEQDYSADSFFSYRLRGISITKGMVNIATTDYQYDRKDNILCKHFSDGVKYYDECFIYDEMDRLKSASSAELYGPDPKIYEYDELDNITLKDGRSYEYNTSVKPHQVISDGTYSYSYDPNGNMTHRSDGRVIVYDFDNRMVSISDGGSFNYDDSGQRTRKVENGVTTYYFFPQYEEEVKSGQTVATKYYFANNARVAQRSIDRGLLYYHADHLGSAIRFTDKDGNCVRTLAFGPYGEDAYSETVVPDENLQLSGTVSGLHQARYNITVENGEFVSGETELRAGRKIVFNGNMRVEQGATLRVVIDEALLADGPIPVKYLYTGQEKENNGVYYYGARYYDPVLGRFLSPDTVLDGLNRYAYCHNNPVKYVDPTGNDVCNPGENGFPEGPSIPETGSIEFDGIIIQSGKSEAPPPEHNNYQFYNPIYTARGTETGDPSLNQGPPSVPYAGRNNFGDGQNPSNGQGMPSTNFWGTLKYGFYHALNFDLGWDQFGWAADNFQNGNIGLGIFNSLSGGGEAFLDIAALYGVASLFAAKATVDGIEAAVYYVYRSVNSKGEVQYVGITKDLARRAAEHILKKGIQIEKVASNLTRNVARAMEQALIEIHGLEKNGGTLTNQINSISQTNPVYDLVSRAREILQSIGYK